MGRKAPGYSGSMQLLRTILIALFAALSYMALIFFRIPYPGPSDPFIHLGNMIVLLAALLLGGWQGGLSGSVGMGLFDLLNGYAMYAPKTIILKFGIGFFAGMVASGGLQHPARSPRKGIAFASVVSLILGGALLAGKLLGWNGFQNISFIAYVFLLSLGVLLASLIFLSIRFSFVTNQMMYAALGAVAGIAWNVIGEFVGVTIMKMIAGYTWQAAMLASLLSLPATLINGSFSIVGAVLIYLPLKQALIRARLGHMLAR